MNLLLGWKIAIGTLSWVEMYRREKMSEVTVKEIVKIFMSIGVWGTKHLELERERV